MRNTDGCRCRARTREIAGVPRKPGRGGSEPESAPGAARSPALRNELSAHAMIGDGSRNGPGSGCTWAHAGHRRIGSSGAWCETQMRAPQTSQPTSKDGMGGFADDDTSAHTTKSFGFMPSTQTKVLSRTAVRHSRQDKCRRRVCLSGGRQKTIEQLPADCYDVKERAALAAALFTTGLPRLPVMLAALLPHGRSANVS